MAAAADTDGDPNSPGFQQNDITATGSPADLCCFVGSLENFDDAGRVPGLFSSNCDTPATAWAAMGSLAAASRMIVPGVPCLPASPPARPPASRDAVQVAPPLRPDVCCARAATRLYLHSADQQGRTSHRFTWKIRAFVGGPHVDTLLLHGRTRPSAFQPLQHSGRDVTASICGGRGASPRRGRPRRWPRRCPRRCPLGVTRALPSRAGAKALASHGEVLNADWSARRRAQPMPAVQIQWAESSRIRGPSSQRLGR